MLRLGLLIALIGLFAGCTTAEPEAFIVSVVADGVERSYRHTEPITVEQFLQEVEVEVNSLDRVNPQVWTQIYDGIRITVVRVEEEEYCEEEEVGFEIRTQLYEGLDPGEQQITQVGQTGLEQVCYRVRVEDGLRREPVEISRTPIREPQDEIIVVGPTESLEPVPIVGTLAYLSNNNAWVIRGSSTEKRLVTFSSDLDPRVFSLSPDGRQLLIARTTEGSSEFGNQLWLVNDTRNENAEPVELPPQDVLYAEWVPGVNNTISYSTGEPRDSAPGWQALNDLWIMRIDPQSGDQINIEQVLEPGTNGGLYGWWGRQYQWSVDGNRLAWIHADSIGVVDLESGELSEPLLRYAPLTPLGDWSWRATVSWSPNSDLISTVTHGPPFGNERPEDSPVFNISVVATDGSFNADVVEQAGIWSAPIYSPEITDTDNPFPRGYLAYLKAREWQESINGEYDLVVADRDGSNARVIFPPEGQPGIRAQVGDIAWSPDGQQIALIYLGNLWIVNVETGISHQLTQDGGASKPIWTR